MTDHGHQEVLANFIAITDADEAAALSMLEASNWQLEEAVNLYYLAHEGSGGHAAAGSAGASRPANSGGGPHAPPTFNDEDEVRAPIASKVDRLYGDHYESRAYQYGLQRQQRQQQQQVDIFRDFKAEAEAAKNASANGAGASAAGPSGLSELFKPPKDLLLSGSFDLAKARAAQEGKWLLLNVQSSSEFASHRLNRDTWSHDALKEMLKGLFIFYQQYDTHPEGQKLCSYYHLHSFPATMVVDPITGAKLFLKVGFVDAEKLIEDLVPFMDHGPKDPGAGMLAQQMTLKRKHQHTLPGPAAQASVTEDEEMQLAIAMSMQEGTGTSRQDAGTSAAAFEESDIDEEALWAQIQQRQQQQQQMAMEPAAPAPVEEPKPSPEQVQQEAEQRLPPEPAEASPSACRVAFRLPDGQRMQRRFNRTDAVQALHDYCLTKLSEAAAGRQFDLLPAIPGATPLMDKAALLEAAGVANAMLTVKWQD